jgi:hypothetical protein
MKRSKTSTALALVAIGYGSWWTYTALIRPVFRFLAEEKGASDYIWMLVFPPILSIPGLMALVFGIALIRKPDKGNIKGTAGGLAILGTIWLAASSKPLYSESIEGTLPFLTASLLAIPAYVFVSKHVMARESLTPEPRGEFIGKGIILLIALQIWSVGGDAIDAYAPLREGYSHIKEEPWDTLGVIGPIFIAWLFYSISVRILGTDIRDKAVETASDGQPCSLINDSHEKTRRTE